MCIRDSDEGEGIRTVHVALEEGINLIDVAPYYGQTRAEAVLGKALRGIPRESYYLATKVGRYGAREFDFSSRRVTESVDESLGRLGTDHIDLIQVHDIEFGSLEIIIEETIPALRELQHSGKVGHVGITGLPVGIFSRVAQRAEVDTVLSYHVTASMTLPCWEPFRSSRSGGSGCSPRLRFRWGCCPTVDHRIGIPLRPS